MSNGTTDPAFGQITEFLNAFAASANGELTVKHGISAEDVQRFGSDFTRFLADTYKSIQRARGKPAPTLDFSSAEVALASFCFTTFLIECPFEDWTIKFESLCVPRGVLEKLAAEFPSLPLLPINVTCRMSPSKDFTFYMIKGAKFRPITSIGKGRGLGRLFKPFVPQVVLKAHEMASRTPHAVKLGTSFLEGNYFAKSNDPKSASDYINAPTVGRHFLSVPIDSLAIGPSADALNQPVSIWQLATNIDGKKVDPLQTLLELAKSSLLRLEELNIVARSR